MTHLALYVDAVRAMRAQQIAGRLRRLIPPAVLARGTHAVPRRATPIAAGLAISPAPQFDSPPPHEAGRFQAFGFSRSAAAPDLWTAHGEDLIFLFHLHGFVRLAEYAGGERSLAGDAFWARVVGDWLKEQSKPRLPGWHPYPTSLRIASWTAAVSAIDSWSADLRRRMMSEIWREAGYLQRSIEHDIGGNHVVKNATALAFAGSLFPTSALMPRALRLLRREVGRQLLVDGGHEERSTSYHREVAADLADVRELLRRGEGRYEPSWLGSAIGQMEDWLEALAGPDRSVPLLNDAWEGPRLPRRRRDPLTVLGDSGYVVLRHGTDQLVLDVGPLCPPHLPPHAHADALSFVLWVDGRPLVVDPGSYTYTGSERNGFRSTAAHNSLQVDGQDQCLFWGDFRAAKLPRVSAPRIREVGDLVVVSSRHDGYTRLPDPVEHERMLVWWPGAGIVVLDRLHARAAHRASLSLHLAPGLDPESLPGGVSVTALSGAAPLQCEPARYSPRLGVAQPIRRLRYECVLEPGRLVGWTVLRPGVRVLDSTPTALTLERDGRRLTVETFQG